MKIQWLFIPIALLVLTCSRNDQVSDAYGNFTTREVIVSAENSGKILEKNIEEGDRIKTGEVAYSTDTVQTYLKREELLARRQSLIAKRINIQAQIDVLNEQERALKIDLQRFQKLLPEGAVSQKQVDDLENNLTVLQKQIQQVKTNFISVNAETDAVDATIRQTDDMLRRSVVKSPIDGTVIETYAEAGEIIVPGKPFFKVASLDTMKLKAYFSARQLAEIKLGDKVKVLTDDGYEGMREYEGRISWIAASAEFTPKIIQTRDERVNLVYAVKIDVINDGYIRINMPGEVRLIRGIAEK